MATLPITTAPSNADHTLPRPPNRLVPPITAAAIASSVTWPGCHGSAVPASGAPLNVEVRLEIQADIPGGAPDDVVRTVTENARTLKFDQHGFEQE